MLKPAHRASPGAIRTLPVPTKQPQHHIFFPAAVMISIALTFPAAAFELPAIRGDFEATVTATTDYVSRGISETAGEPALQGTFDYAHDSGFFAEIFASRVHFENANVELDYGVGHEGKTLGLDYELSLIYHSYPGAASRLNYDYGEAVLEVRRRVLVPLTLIGAVAVSPDYFGGSGRGTYVEGGGDLRLPLKFMLGGRFGHQWVERPEKAGVPDYFNWSLGISRALFGFTGTVLYTDTNLSRAQCAFGRDCSRRVLLSVSYRFE